MKVLSYQYEADLRLEHLDLSQYYAFTQDHEAFYCLDCAVNHFEEPLEDLIDHGQLDTIHEDTFQYEQWPGQLIPLAGIECAGCGENLYPGYEEYQ